MSRQLECNSTKRQWLGWAAALCFAIIVLSIGFVLLYVNSQFCQVVATLIPTSPDVGVNAAVQVVTYIMPAVLTVLQWYFFDRLRRVVT